MNRCLILGVLFLGVAALAADAQEPDAVRITLLREATVDDVVVTLEQIARISGGTASARKRIGRLDILDFKLGASQQTVTSERVRFRLLLAGIDAAAFQLEGARRTMILESDRPLTRRIVLAAAEEAVRSRYAGDPRTTMRAHGGFTLPDLEGISAARIRLTANVKGYVPTAGFARAEIGITVNGSLREVVPVDVEIVEPAPASAPAQQLVQPAVHWVPANDMKPTVVKSRDTVKLVAYLGAVRIVAGGEAQQDGRIGQMIRVRNLSSNEIVIGRIEADGIVVVEH